MRLRLVAAAATLCIVAACAPDPTGAPTAGPETGAPTQEASASATPSVTAPIEESEPAASPTETEASEPSETATDEESEQPSTAPTSEPAASESASSAPPAEPAKPIAEGWNKIDKKLTSEAEVASLGLPGPAADYLERRLKEPCELEISIFAAHSGGFLVGDESGICEGAGLFVYGPSNGQMRDLVEFTAVEECSTFEAAGVPKGVPGTAFLPDGLACMNGESVEQY